LEKQNVLICIIFKIHSKNADLAKCELPELGQKYSLMELGPLIWVYPSFIFFLIEGGHDVWLARSLLAKSTGKLKHAVCGD
jgi:hypothetical protein